MRPGRGTARSAPRGASGAMLRCGRPWATSTGTSSRATSATSRATFHPRPSCSTWVAGRRGWPSTTTTTRGWTGRQRRGRGPRPRGGGAGRGGGGSGGRARRRRSGGGGWGGQGADGRAGGRGRAAAGRRRPVRGRGAEGRARARGQPGGSRPRGGPGSEARPARVRLLARRAALGLGRLHAPPPVHTQGVQAALRRQRLRGGALGLRVGGAGHEHRVALHALEAAAGPPACRGVGAGRAPQRVDTGAAPMRQTFRNARVKLPQPWSLALGCAVYLPALAA